METLRFRRFGLLILVLILCALVGASLWRGNGPHRRAVRGLGTVLIAPGPTGMLVDAKSAIGDESLSVARARLQGVARLIKVFSAIHAGAMPTDSITLFADAQRRPPAYGYLNAESVQNALSLPDTSGPARPNARYRKIPFAVRARRLDGTPLHAARPYGTRDVVSWSDEYFHESRRIYRDRASTAGPEGYYLVLWDDGSVARVPYEQTLRVDVTDPAADDVMYARLGISRSTHLYHWTVAFPGEAGLPHEAIPYGQWLRRYGGGVSR